MCRLHNKVNNIHSLQSGPCIQWGGCNCTRLHPPGYGPDCVCTQNARLVCRTLVMCVCVFVYMYVCNHTYPIMQEFPNAFLREPYKFHDILRYVFLLYMYCFSELFVHLQHTHIHLYAHMYMCGQLMCFVFLYTTTCIHVCEESCAIVCVHL